MRFEQEKYNHWTILCILPPKKENHWNKWCICRCDCGKIYKKQYCCIKHGHSKQCVDCGNKSRRHTEDYLRLYSVYIQMKERCLKKNHQNYTDYGGRGIKICNEWLNSYKKFYEWAINTGYKKGLSIDRINVDGNYCPENCRWADRHTQSANKRKYSFNNSGYTGVNTRKYKNVTKYEARIKINKKIIIIGTFKTPERACIARDRFIINNNLREYPLQILDWGKK